MTRDDIKLPPYLCASYEGDDLFTGDQLVEVVRAAVLAEREACARVCEKEMEVYCGFDKESYAGGRALTSAADAIRARGES